MTEITITSKRDGFRRCGVAHKDTPVVWPEGSFTAEQIATLKAEPMLVVYDGAQVSQGSLEREASGLRDRNTELETRSEQLTGEIVTLKASLQVLTDDKEALQKSVDALNADKAQLQTSVDTLTGEKAELQKQVDELKGAKK